MHGAVHSYHPVKQIMTFCKAKERKKCGSKQQQELTLPCNLKLLLYTYECHLHTKHHLTIFRIKTTNNLHLIYTCSFRVTGLYTIININEYWIYSMVSLIKRYEKPCEHNTHSSQKQMNKKKRRNVKIPSNLVLIMGNSHQLLDFLENHPQYIVFQQF